MKSFQVTEAARTDLLEIWQYIRADNIDAADNVIDRLHDAFVKLGRNPMIGLCGKTWPIKSTDSFLSIRI